VVFHLSALFSSEACGSELDVTYVAEEKSQLNTKIKVEGTVDKTVFEEFKKIYALEVKKAKEEDRAEPLVSHVLEMLLRKGIKKYNTDRKNVNQKTIHDAPVGTEQ